MQAGATAAGPSPSRGVPAEGTSSKATGKRPITVNLDADPAPKRGRQTEPGQAIFAAEDDEAPAEPVTLACPSKTVQFVNHMILGSQMELSEIEDLPKKLLWEEAGRAFRLQASTSMDTWLCVKQAINAAEKAKKAYEDGRARVAEAGKAIQAHANLAKDMQAAERQVKVYEAKFAEMSAALESAQLTAKEALEAVQVTFEESERAKASEIEAVVQEAIRGMTEGLSVGVSEPISPRSLDADDLVRSFPGRSKGSFHGILSCQRDFSHDPISDSERAGSDPGVVVPRDALFVSFVAKVGLRSAFFDQVEA
ncbi:unnamed protein product [Prunus armeniaca]